MQQTCVMKYILASLALLVAVPAVADDEYLKRAIAVLQAQRNEAADRAVVAEAKGQGLEEELKRVRADLAALKEKHPDPEQKKPD